MPQFVIRQYCKKIDITWHLTSQVDIVNIYTTVYWIRGRLRVEKELSHSCGKTTSEIFHQNLKRFRRAGQKNETCEGKQPHRSYRKSRLRTLVTSRESFYFSLWGDCSCYLGSSKVVRFSFRNLFRNKNVQSKH